MSPSKDRDVVPYEPPEDDAPADMVASAEVSRLLEAVSIKRVVCVDDQYALGPEAFLGVTASLGGEERQALLGVESESEELDDDEVWREVVRERWPRVGRSDQVELYGRAIEMAGGDPKPEDADEPVVSGLPLLFDAVDFIPLSMAEWCERRVALLKDAAETKTLFMFDRSFTREDEADDAGERLVEEFLSDAEHIDVWLGLLTHTVDVEGQLELWRTLAQRMGTRAKRLVVISKEAISATGVEFAEILRVTLLAPSFAALTSSVLTSLTDAYETADRLVNELSPYELEAVIFLSSGVESVWEPETLVRIYRSAHLREAGIRLRQDAEVHRATIEIRNLVEMRPGGVPEDGPREYATYPRVRQLQRLEVFQTAEEINPIHLPLEAGDIFSRVSGSKSFVLVGQPCDLMVRRSGKRAHELSSATLVEVRLNRAATKPTEFDLPYFDPVSYESAIVDLSSAHTVSLDILDLCVFNPEGRVQIGIADRCPDGLVPAWMRRFEVLSTRFAGTLATLSRLAKTSKERREIAGAMGVLGASAPCSMQFRDNDVEFGLRRVGRLRRDYATALLARYGHHLTRDAFEHDLTRIS